MATLHEYFVKDGAQNLTHQQTWLLTNAYGEKLGELIARLHLDFDAHAKYISFFIPEMPAVECPEAFALNKTAEMLKWPETQVGVQAGFGDERKDARELVFTGQIYLYSERPVPEDLKVRLITEAKGVGHRLTFRSVEYMNERNKWEKPRAFISHDSRDKASIAEPIALQFQKFMCPVWYDQFSLRVGDSLRESIERGLKECRKCILVLTPNFLSNKGWSMREYDSIFTREIVERQRVILPVWHEISAQDVYQFSPILADRVAVQWSLGVEEVARKLLQAIDG
jgi:TIR domain